MAAPIIQERPADPDGKWTVLGVCVLLAVAVFVVFSQTLRYGFVNFDDNGYFSSNYHVKSGLTWNGALWAFRTGYASNWHPLTWLSLMLDAQLFGLGPFGPHLTNVLLHAANAVLLFLLLRRMMGLRPDIFVGAAATPAGTIWPSAFVAALFAIHPLRVESVAWVAERKDVLSGLFFMLTLLMYARYVQNCAKSQVSGVRWLGSRDYWLAVLFFTLGLMSKPMLVTVPFVLLLLDWWPLERFTIYDLRFTIRRLIWEKIPFFGLSAAACVATILAQREVIYSTIDMPLNLRFGNALMAYVTYCVQMVWPDNLAVFYPYRFDVPVWQIAGAGVLLLSVTVLVMVAAKRFPYLPVGWLWYLGMLVPVIGLVQVGDQSHADRYTYLPQVGLYLVIVWAIRDWTKSWRWRRQVLGVTAGIVLAVLMAGAWEQTAYWRDSESLWMRALACTSGNYIVYSNLGATIMDQGRFTEGIGYYQKALELDPDNAVAHNNLGVAKLKMKRTEEAMVCFQKTLEINPNFAEAYYNLGCVFDKQGRLDEALRQYQQAIELKSDFAEAHNSWGRILDRQGRQDEAIEQYRKAVELKPDYVDAHYNLGGILGLQNRLAEAIEEYRKAVEFKPDYVDAHGNLANALAAQGKLKEATQEYRRTLAMAPNSAQAHYKLGLALQSQHNFTAASAEYQRTIELDPKHLPAHLSLAWLLATSPDNALRNGEKAVKLAEQARALAGIESPQLLDTLAAAYAEAGRFDEAVETAKRTLNLNATRNNQPLADALQMRLKLYEANAPYHEKP